MKTPDFLNFRYCLRLIVLALLSVSAPAGFSAVNVALQDVPDYSWDAGCFGTASGNLMGYWDRHGLPNFYTGPTAGGVAPLNSAGPNEGIRALWASRAGVDGRSPNQPGHMDDYWFEYESTPPDPYVTANRPEHAPDSIGDFIGLNQNKWSNLNGECDGNIDGFSFVFWDATGDKRLNYQPKSPTGAPIPDIPSGLRAWTRFRGYEADSFSQLADFNPSVHSGHGFSFADLKAEIDAGYPVLLYLQNFDQFSRALAGMPRANPDIHGMLAYGYYIPDSGDPMVRYKTSWGSSGDYSWSKWDAGIWQAQMPLRGVIGYHPLPKLTQVVPTADGLHLEWEGPSSVMVDLVSKTAAPLHWYVVERSTSLQPSDFEPVSSPTSDNHVTLANCCPDEAAFYRLKIVPAPPASAP